MIHYYVVTILSLPQLRQNCTWCCHLAYHFAILEVNLRITGHPYYRDMQYRTVMYLPRSLYFGVVLFAVVIPGELRRYHAKMRGKLVKRSIAAVKTRNSSGDEIANVNFLRRHRTRTTAHNKVHFAYGKHTCLQVPTIIDARIGLNSLQRGHFDSKFQAEGVAPHQSFLHG